MLLSLRTVVTHGWPDTRSECPSHLHAYWNYRDELTVADDIILKGTRILIPTSLQPAVLQQFHYAHQGAEKCKLRVKGSVFWANINRDIEEMVKCCAPCQRNQNLNVKEPLVPHDIPPKPWHTLGSDLVFWNNSSYLLVSDYYSKFPLVRKLDNMRSDTTVAHLKAIFEEHGIPSKLVTGNDTQFTSARFQEFSSKYGFVQNTKQQQHRNDRTWTSITRYRLHHSTQCSTKWNHLNQWTDYFSNTQHTLPHITSWACVQRDSTPSLLQDGETTVVSFFHSIFHTYYGRQK